MDKTKENIILLLKDKNLSLKAYKTYSYDNQPTIAYQIHHLKNTNLKIGAPCFNTDELLETLLII